MTIAGKLLHLLTPEQRRRAAVLLALMLLGMVLETLGVGLVIPALSLMTNNDLASEYPVLAPWLVRLGNPNHERVVVGGMIALAGVYAIKAVFLAFLAWRQARFSYGLQAHLSQRLFSGYLGQPYTFHLARNSAQLIRNTIGLVSSITNLFQQGLMLLTEILVVIGISVLLLLVEPLGAMIVMMTMGLAAFAFNRFTRNGLLRWGEAFLLHERMRIQHLQQGLGGVKEVKLLGREGDFVAEYKMHNAGSARVSQHQAVLGALPRLWLEWLAVSGLAVLVLVMIGHGKSLEAVLPTLGLFAAAAFRLMPSLNRVLGALQNVRFSLPVVETLDSEFRLMESIVPSQPRRLLTFETALTLDQVSFRYPSTKAYALRNVSIAIPRGASVGFIGGSGAGKSTLVDVILGLLTPESGAVKIDGVDIQSNLRGWQDQIGYVPQSIFLTDDSLRRNVAFGLPNESIDDAAVRRAICAAQLEAFVSELPQGLETVVGERGIRLSGGQRQRIGIARALYHEPAVLVLDEATSSLDTLTEQGVMDAVRALQGEKTILIVAHRLSTIECCQRVFRLEDGRVLDDGGWAAALTNTASGC